MKYTEMNVIRDKILVVGGYGNVGRVICGYLAEKFPGKIIAAGRSYQHKNGFHPFVF